MRSYSAGLVRRSSCIFGVLVDGGGSGKLATDGRHAPTPCSIRFSSMTSVPSIREKLR